MGKGMSITMEPPHLIANFLGLIAQLSLEELLESQEQRCQLNLGVCVCV